MKTSALKVKVGIYDTQYTIRDCGEEIIVKTPYIRWKNNNGNLSFTNVSITNKRNMARIREMVENDELVTGDDLYPVTIDDIVEGRV